MIDRPDPHLTLCISCPDRVGIVARVATFLAQHGGWILESNHHADPDTRRFFMRNVIRTASLPFGAEEFADRFSPIAREFAMDWRLSDSRRPRRVVLLASRADHCLVDVLHRWRSGDLDCDIPCIVANHPDLRPYAEFHGIAFHHVPVTPETKAAAHARLAAIFEEVGADVVVLARYMQILPPELCARYPGRIINIHHSFLPSFSGANPYRRAFDRGVKLIGATCHYVTDELDEGPIIEQDVIRIDHGDAVEDLVRYGKDIERQVLARGLKYHLEDRVLLNGRKTVVFR
ncbi:MAG TPA: formyltetrahydrofolate deformylase [Steroidobacteraceae bacterium]